MPTFNVSALHFVMTAVTNLCTLLFFIILDRAVNSNGSVRADDITECTTVAANRRVHAGHPDAAGIHFSSQKNSAFWADRNAEAASLATQLVDSYRAFIFFHFGPLKRQQR